MWESYLWSGSAAVDESEEEDQASRADERGPGNPFPEVGGREAYVCVVDAVDEGAVLAEASARGVRRAGIAACHVPVLDREVDDGARARVVRQEGGYADGHVAWRLEDV